MQPGSPKPEPDLSDIEVEPLVISSGLCDTPEHQEAFDRDLAGQPGTAAD